MRSWITVVVLFIVAVVSPALAEAGAIKTEQAPLTVQETNRTGDTQVSVSPKASWSRSENWRSVLLYAEFTGSAFENYFNQQESLTFLVSAENGGRLRKRIALDYPEQPHKVFIGEIAVNQKKLVLTAQAIHNYVNPAKSYRFPILNAKNNQLLSFESEIKVATLETDYVASSVTIKVIGREGWFSDPNYELQLIAHETIASTQD